MSTNPGPTFSKKSEPDGCLKKNVTTITAIDELAKTQSMIDENVRNQSATKTENTLFTTKPDTSLPKFQKSVSVKKHEQKSFEFQSSMFGGMMDSNYASHEIMPTTSTIPVPKPKLLKATTPSAQNQEQLAIEYPTFQMQTPREKGSMIGKASKLSSYPAPSSANIATDERVLVVQPVLTKKETDAIEKAKEHQAKMKSQDQMKAAFLRQQFNQQ